MSENTASVAHGADRMAHCAATLHDIVVINS
jgi:hypothetical protein